jgi:hypothetical protein
VSPRNRQQVFAIIRIELRMLGATVDVDDVQTYLAVTKVLPTLDEAESEATRLNRNHSNDNVYIVQTTRFYPEGLLPQAS